MTCKIVRCCEIATIRSHPVAPLTKEINVPMGASFSRPSTIASPSPTNNTCFHGAASCD